MKIYSLPFGADFISAIGDFIMNMDIPLDEIAVVFPGRRPSLYLKEKLAEKIEKPFFSPAFFSIEDFVDYLCRKTCHDFSDIHRADAVLLLYRAIDTLGLFSDGFFRERGIGDFYGWGLYMLDFIDRLDMEDIRKEDLSSLGFNAEIGYDAPKKVNELLREMGIIREAFHKLLDEKRLLTKGYKHQKAIESLKGSPFDDFKKIVFAGLFALSSTEKAIIKEICINGKGEVIFEGIPEDWPLLRNLAEYLNGDIESLSTEGLKGGSLRIYSAIDVHGEALKVYEILEGVDSKKTAIVLPSSDALFPVLTFATDRLKKSYNISLGYPLSRTSIYNLLNGILEAQLTRGDKSLYLTTSYLNLMLHPFIKNLTSTSEIRPIIGEVKNYLTKGPARSSIISPYISIVDIENHCETIPDLDRNGFLDLKNIHRHLFTNLEGAENLYELILKLEETLSYIIDCTPVRSYALSEEIFRCIFESFGVLKNTEISRERFATGYEENRRHICEFLLNHIKNITIPFDTKPIEPLEVLGVLETRCISFDTVIILDMEEGVFPQPKKIDPVVPIAVYDQLGIPSTKYNEEIYRYHFYRLISSAREVHLLYLESEESQRSRYVEQLIWREEKRKNLLDAVPVEKYVYRINLSCRETPFEIKKTDKIIKAIKRKILTPTALDDYLLCPLLFYYKHILDFQERRVLSDDIDNLDRGIVIHQILYETFSGFIGKPVGQNNFDELVFSLHNAIEKRFKDQVEIGDLYLFKELLRYKLERYMEKDIKEGNGVFIVRFLEETFHEEIDVNGYKVPFKGKIDRIDFLPEDKTYLIIDYKTGGKKEYGELRQKGFDTKSIEEIHNRIKSLQLPLYVLMFQDTFKIPLDEINAELVLLQKNEREILFKTKKTEERSEIIDLYMDCIRTVVVDMFDENRYIKPFDYEYCPNCYFNNICKT